MREYFKILGSIVLGLLCFMLIVSSLQWMEFAYTGEPIDEEWFVLPLMMAFIGFFMFGITGSIFWRLFLMIFTPLNISTMKKHIYASLLSTLMSLVVFSVQYEETNMYGFSLFVLFVVGLSLVMYRLLFIRASHDERLQRSVLD